MLNWVVNEYRKLGSTFEFEGNKFILTSKEVENKSGEIEEELKMM